MRLLQPLGMRSARLSDEASTRRRLATGYDSDGKTPIPYWHMIFPPPGAINATPRAMGALPELFLRRGRGGNERLLDTATIERMERPATYLDAPILLGRQITHQARCWLDEAISRIERELQQRIQPRKDYQLL